MYYRTEISNFVGTILGRNKKTGIASLKIEGASITQTIYHSRELESTQAIYRGLRLVSSGNFFLVLNRSHHFLFKKVKI